MDRPQTNRFKDAVLATPVIKECYKQGLQALGNDSRKVELSDVRKAGGSVDIDSCMARTYPIANRWDYAIGYDNEAYFAEVHPAETGEVPAVLKKLQWLKDWLLAEAPEVNEIKAKERTPFYWIQSGRFRILKTSRQYRQLVNAGLLPISRLKL